ncbi:hypothetical protein E8A74_24635 [Polyangium fumosum]|uniref:Uncharacterized protein n=2 Tax=Polyangium fumosum TaxID=889272 RepID=A0A4U1J894_9BACT|nr:hypothetical protein E8A74_24635 [Polyangium fumosum]
MNNGTLLNLNWYRGLQVIDVSDVTEPKIVGQLQVGGSPVEMYVDGTRAILLMNDWYGYKGRPNSLEVDSKSGSTVMLVDISTPSKPVVLSQYAVPGYIQTSRYANGATQDALFVASSYYNWFINDQGYWEWILGSTVKSFDVGQTAMTEKSELPLGGYVSAIHAENEVLLVAREKDWWSSHQSDVAVIDISDNSGTMVKRDEVTVNGYVRSQFHMDYRNDQLRIFSGPQWGWGQHSYLQTFDATNLDNVTPIDTVPFGADMNLFAAVFLDDRAFAVTYRNYDPFHAFSIDANGHAEEKSEFIVSGWNDFFRPAFNNTRLVGIGVDDQNGRKLAVSLYNITDLENPNPLLAREEVAGEDHGWNWSEANWDHRAFSVLHNAVNVTAPTGETETGLVLLPFAGYKYVNGSYSYESAVQIFTFSESTITRRGIMNHPDAVRRTFKLDATNGANLSETQLRIWDQSNLDAPQKVGELGVAPDYTKVWVYDNYRARLRGPDNSDYWYWYSPDAKAKVDIIRNNEPVDTGTPVATIEVPANASYYQVDDLLVAVHGKWTTWPTFETTIEVWDLSNPKKPAKAGQLVTTELPSGYYYYGDYYGNVNVVGKKSLGFVETSTVQSDPVSMEYCYAYTYYWSTSCRGQEGCTYFTGSRDCRTINGQTEYCSGGFAQCTDHANAETTCVPADWSQVEAAQQGYSYCYGTEYEAALFRTKAQLKLVNLSNPNHPTLLAPIDLTPGQNEEFVTASGHDDDIYVTVKKPASAPGDTRTYAQYFLKEIDLKKPAQPKVGAAINVPGTLLSKDGSTIFTRDPVWGQQDIIETAVSKLKLQGNKAELENKHHFADRTVNALFIDKGGRPVVSHNLVWEPYSYYTSHNDRFSILKPKSGNNNTFEVLSNVKRPSGASLISVAERRAFFSLNSGVLMADLDNPAMPTSTAFFPGQNWYYSVAPVIDDDEVLIAAGRYGVHEADLDTHNLLTTGD